MTVPIQTLSSQETSALPNGNTIFLKIGNKLDKVYLSDIDIIKSDGNYCEIHAGSRRFVIKKSLLAIAAILPEHMFERIHMRHLVAFQKISKIDLNGNVAYINDVPVPIGRRYRSDLIRKLNVL